MKAFKLLYHDTENTLRSDPSYYLRSAARNLPDWLVEWYKEGVETKSRFPSLPLWAFSELSHANEVMGTTLLGSWEVWECEVELWDGPVICLSSDSMNRLERTDSYDAETVERYGYYDVGFYEYIQTTHTIFCKTVKLLRRVK